MAPFAYPKAPRSRQHGPEGYAQCEAYRPWLRDEFAFRCVYCLAREQWHKGRYGFHVDHLVPQSEEPRRVDDYDNLVYACATCNLLKKGFVGVPDPCKVAYATSLRVGADGRIEALDRDGVLLVKVLRLENDENTEYRRVMLEILELARLHDRSLYVELLRYPDDLPNLAAKRPPGGNSRPKGVAKSHLARRQRAELDETY